MTFFLVFNLKIAIFNENQPNNLIFNIIITLPLNTE